MDNITKEQLRIVADNIINSAEFNNVVDDAVNNEMYYYKWLKDYLKFDDFKSPFTSAENHFNYMIDYVYKCMMLDGFVKEYSNTSLVYFIRNKYTGLLKIGKTDNIKRRVAEIKNCFNFLGLESHNLSLEAIAYCPFGVNNSKVETYYHKEFSDNRKIGEWFDISYEDLVTSLNIDYVINNVLISVEDIADFSTNVKRIKLAEENKNELKNKINKEISNKIYKEFLVLNNSPLFGCFQSNKNIGLPSKDFYNYIVNLKSSDDTNLSNKIEKTLSDILDDIII